jgi:O-succinylbenzoate synthase
MSLADPGLAAVLDAAVPFALPLTRRFRGIEVREGMLIRGPRGWGEFAPFDDYSDAAAALWLDSAIEAAFGEWPAALREAVAVNAIIPAVESAVAASMARDAVLLTGCTTVKVKVGDPDLADDEARVASIRDVLDTTLGRGVGRIRIDANAAWDVPRAEVALRRLGAYGLEYVEQPCRTVEELREIRSRIDVPVAVDETVRTSDAPGRLRLRDVADVAVVKPAPVGGVQAALRIVESLDVPVVISGSLDSSVGLDVGIAAAAAVMDLPYACGFGTGALLAADVTEHTRVPVDGALAVQRVLPDLPSLLAARDRLDEERAAWWRRRLASAWLAGAGKRSGALVLASA